MTFEEMKLFVFDESGEMVETAKNIPVNVHMVYFLYKHGCYVEDFHYRRYTELELIGLCR